VFGRGTPLLPGIANPDWYTEVSQRQHTWFVRWNGEEDMSTTMDIDDAANDYLTRHRGEAEGAYVLDLDTFYRIALPAIAVYLVKYRFRDTKNHIPASIFDFERWSLSPS
jgi:hypothetical protein